MFGIDPKEFFNFILMDAN